MERTDVRARRVLLAVGVALGAGAVLLAALVAVRAITDEGDLGLVNDGAEDVTFSTGDEQSVVTADGGVVLLGYGCSPGDVTVTFASGRVEVVPGPVCPDEQVVVTGAGEVVRQAAPSGG